MFIHSHKSISPSIAKKVVTTKYLAKFQSPRAISQPKIIGPERNVNLICTSSLYTHIPKNHFFRYAWRYWLMRVYKHKLQIIFEIRSGWMIFGQLTAVGFCNLAKYLVVITFFFTMIWDIDLVCEFKEAWGYRS
jgi:hypothetical protein